MLTLLLIIIYIAFISLGLPDSILGSAWPVIHQELQVSVSMAGLLSMIVSVGTVISSLLSEKMLRRFGTGVVTVSSVALTACGLLGFTAAPGYLWLCFLCIPLGIGAGAIDAALNNFVALHYEAKHMNWLHCFWGIGATSGPLIMSLFLMKEGGWRIGYGIIGGIQSVLVICLLFSLPLWKRFERSAEQESGDKPPEMKLRTLLKLRGAKPALVSFFCYCGVELTTGLWGSTYLVTEKGLSAGTAAKWISLYYMGITAGRMIAGFVSMKLDNRKMMKIGQLICLAGAVLLLMPFSVYFQMAGFTLIGLGCAPIYPAMLHETPNRFGKELSAGIMGIQMAVAYIGSTTLPPVFGFLAKFAGFRIMPFYLLFFAALMLITTEMVNNRKHEAFDKK